MNYVIKTGKTVDEAVSKALKELNITREDAEIEILEEGQKGFLGIIGSKDATVKVTKTKDTKDLLKEIFSEEIESEKSQQEPVVTKTAVNSENKKDPVDPFKDMTEQAPEKKPSGQSQETIEEVAREFLTKVMDALGIDYDLDLTLEDRHLKVDILGDEKKLGIVIGKRGVTLDAIQYILNLIVNKNSDQFIRVSVDSSGYRKKREETLKDLAKKMASKVIRNNRSIRLEPMNAYERKIIHEALQSYEGVLTHSEGKEPYRKVVIQKERKY